MSWLQLHLQTNAEHHEPISAWLEALGAVSITLQDAADQPLLEPKPGELPIWQNVGVCALFTGDTDVQAIFDTVYKRFPEQISHYHIESLEEQEWTRKWLDDFRPMCFGQRLWICPSGYPIPDPDACNIHLDPGLAFGTGTHPTTRLCLQWLDQAISGGEEVIDFGCGSGILAIAALKLGAQHAFAIDHDEQALQATIDNARRNAIGPAQLSIADAQQTIPHTADILLANILAKPLQLLAPHFATLVKPGGYLVLSGILREQMDMICASYAPYFDSLETQREDDWLRMVARRITAR